MLRTKVFKISFSLQGRHVKTGQLAAIKVMDVTGVMYLYLAISKLYICNREVSDGEKPFFGNRIFLNI